MPNLIMYKSTANPLQVDKTNYLTQLINVTIPFNEDYDTENGYIILRNNAQTAYSQCNYIRIDGVYYFADDPIYEVGYRVRFNLHKDVLMSNLTEIMNVDIITDRTSKDYNSYIADTSQKTQVNRKIFSIPLGSFSIGGSVILSTIASIGTGGGADE